MLCPWEASGRFKGEGFLPEVGGISRSLENQVRPRDVTDEAGPWSSARVV